MAWIKSHQELRDHPKTRKLAHILNVSRPTAIGHLQCFWWWALDYAADGCLCKFDNLDIALGADWDGDETAFVSAMVHVGFIDQGDDGCLYVHDWDDYAGSLLRRRESDKQRKQASRGDVSGGRPQHVRADTVRSPQHVSDPEKRREEKSREDKSREPITSATPTDGGDNFVEFWIAYPKKAAKQNAMKAFKKIDWSSVRFADVMHALARHKLSAQWLKDDGQFIPHAATWLNGCRWQDDLPAANATPQSPSMSTAQRLIEQAKREKAEYEQARSNRSSGGTGDGMAGEADNGRSEPSLFLVPGGRTG